MIYINHKNDTFSACRDIDNTVVMLSLPVCCENGTEYDIPFIGYDGDAAVYRDDQNEVRLTVEKTSDTLFYLRRTWKNLSDETRAIRIALQVKPCFHAEQYLIPCVSINGNEFGAGGEPKGLERDGKRWVFAYDRVSIPACTLTENADIACALFASAEDALSLQSSCSIF